MFPSPTPPQLDMIHTDPCDKDGLGDLLKDLPPRQAGFVRAYLVEPNGARAALSAGYSGGEGALAVQASRLLRSAKVTKALTAARDRDCASAVLSRGQRLALLSRIATGDVGGDFPPTWSEKTGAMKLIAAMMGEIGPKLSVQVDMPSYVVPLPPRISDPDEWSKMALATMKTIDAQHERLPL